MMTQIADETARYGAQRRSGVLAPYQRLEPGSTGLGGHERRTLRLALCNF
jgi:hypothetical protein